MWAGLRTVRPLAPLALVAILVMVQAAAAQAAFPGANGKIAFYTFREGDAEIYVMNADGSAQTNLSLHTASDFDPAWSPDGTKVAFDTNRDDNYEVYTMNADGSAETRLTTNPALDEWPAWSPDGTRIAFDTNRDGNYEIYKMNADGTGQTRLTSNAALDSVPAWSPNGAMIAFQSQRDGNYEIYVMNADGTGQTRLTNNAVDDLVPRWSPDGTKLAFATNRDGNYEIYTMNPNGTSQTRLTNNPAADEAPAWSPDGTKIAFDSDRNGNFEIYTMNANGSAPIRLTNIPEFDAAPDWQPLPAASPPPTYEVPKLASSLRFSLVPIFRQCGPGAAPNGKHSPPLSVGACLPPQATGVAHFGAQARGTAWLAAVYGDTNTANGDQANMTIRLELADIRSATGGDYNPSATGPDGTLLTRIRLTDRANGPSGTAPGTATEFDFSVPFACTATADPALGSDCRVETSADSVTPGIINENKASVLQVFRLRLADSGPNGVRGDSDDRLFGTQGVYVP